MHIQFQGFYSPQYSMDDIRNDVTINKTGALVWGQKRLQHVLFKYSIVRSVLDMEPLDNNSKK